MTSAAAVFRKGATALITGAASGVGLAVARLCASHSMKLILVDRNASKLDQVKSDLSKAGGTVDTHALDVASISDWASLKSAVEAQGSQLDFLHLNAGIMQKGEWTDTSYFHNIFNVNFFGVVNGINTFYPHFTSSADPTSPKAIVITGSKQGITNPPGNPAYNASKSAVKTLAEHMSFDLAQTRPQTSVHLLVPGWTFTGMTAAGGATEKPAGAWAPEQVAEYLYQHMTHNKFYVICPDNDVQWEEDRKRMTWSMGDLVYERKPLSRWREEYKDEAAATMGAMRLGGTQKGSSA